MKNYLYVVNKRDGYSKIDIPTLINKVKECEHEFKTYRDNNVECYFYTNEDFKYDVKNGDYFIGLSGQLGDSPSYIRKGIEASSRGKEKRFISTLSGANSISYYHTPSNTIEAYNGFSGVNPVYYCENDERIVIGIDPLVVNCVAYQSQKPIFDLSNISSFLMMGYFFSHDTLFKNVKSIPHNSLIIVQEKTVRIEAIDNSVDMMFTQEPTQQNYDEIGKAFLKSFDVIPNTEKKLTVGLTGGKDSRLIALGMNKKGIRFNAITRGHDDHPDVIVAKLLAEEMGLNHVVKHSANKKINEISVDLKKKILRTMLGTNGMLYGYEHISYSTIYKGNIGITGVGAEALRGGFGITREKDVDNISEFLLKTYFPYKDLILPEYRDTYQNELTIIGDNSKSLRETGNKLFIEFYNGKRTASARAALSYYSNSLSPFFDNNFLKLATRVNMDEIATEKVHYNLMRTLNSEVAKLPFANDRWRFERHGPLNPDDFEGWIKRQPVVPKTKRGGYNWRLFRNQDPVFVEAFRKLLLNDQYSEIYEIVDYDKIKKIFTGKVSGNYNRILWSLLSIKIYMDYYNNKETPSSEILLKLPASEDLNVNKNKIYNLFEYITPLNNKLKLDRQKDLVVSVNQESEKFGYLIVGDGNLSTPSSEVLKDLFILDKSRKSLSVRICIDLLSEKVEIGLYIMFFDKEGKRVFSKQYIKQVELGINYLSRIIKMPGNAHSIKYAIRVKSLEVEPIMKIKYGYMKYN